MFCLRAWETELMKTKPKGLKQLGLPAFILKLQKNPKQPDSLTQQTSSPQNDELSTYYVHHTVDRMRG